MVVGTTYGMQHAANVRSLDRLNSLILGGVDWSAVAGWALLGLGVVAVVALVVVGLRTAQGRELVTAAGVRVVKVLLGFMERWMGGQLEAVVSSRAAGWRGWRSGRGGLLDGAAGAGAQGAP